MKRRSCATDLAAHGVPPEKIIVDSRGVTTYETGRSLSSSLRGRRSVRFLRFRNTFTCHGFAGAARLGSKGLYRSPSTSKHEISYSTRESDRLRSNACPLHPPVQFPRREGPNQHLGNCGSSLPSRLLVMACPQPSYPHASGCLCVSIGWPLFAAITKRAISSAIFDYASQNSGLICRREAFGRPEIVAGSERAQSGKAHALGQVRPAVDSFPATRSLHHRAFGRFQMRHPQEELIDVFASVSRHG
jgi:hypothetical protein